MAATRAISRRRRPLHTCAASMLEAIDTAQRKAQEHNGSLGKLARRMTKSLTTVFPFVSTVLHQGLTILSFADDYILFLERLVESIFPPSGRVFDKIDKLVYSAEGIPRRFDEALNAFPSIMQQNAFLDWVVMRLIWWFTIFISILTLWESRNAKENEVLIDLSSDACDISFTESADATNSALGSTRNHHWSSIKYIGSADEENSTAAENAVSATESFRSAESEYEISPPDESIHEIKSSQHADSRSPDERASKEELLPVSCVVKEVEKKPVDSTDHIAAESSSRAQSKSVIPSSTSGASPGKKKSVGEKTIGKDKKKNTNEHNDDQLPILDLFEAKWHST